MEFDDRFLIGHVAFMPVGVTQLIDTDHLIKGLHLFFIAFQRALASDTITRQVS